MPFVRGTRGNIVEFKIEGIREIVKKLNTTVTELRKSGMLGLVRAGELLQSEVKESIAGNRAEPRSVDTGRFLNSVELVKKDKEVIVKSDVPYAKFLEYGTSRMPARSHFRNSVARNKDKMKRIVGREVEVTLSRLW